ncbi:MAG: hypothetical protein VX730_07110 [Pseudomonadota bacterium]|nr:hypothetical protein [Pseudomonadota bacterium]
MAHSPKITFTFSDSKKIIKAAEHLDDVIQAFNKYERAGYPNPFTIATKVDDEEITFLFFKKTWHTFPEMTVGILAKD